jgi:hypothetical protein
MKLSTTKGVMLGLAFAASMVAATSVQASCNVSGQIVERVLTYRNSSSYIYFRPRTALTNSSYYYCRVLRDERTGDRMISEAASAKSNRVEVNAQGTSSSCPTSASRYMGDCYYIYMLN